VGKQRNCSRKASSGARIPGNTIKQSFVMKPASRNNHFRAGGVAPGESRFEKFETGFLFEASAHAPFGRKLQKTFPVPPESSEPEDVRVLLSEIQAKLNNFPVPGEG
jgi:hypothetical protein